MFNALKTAGYPVEDGDADILNSLERLVSFDAAEKITIIEDMYAEPGKKPALVQILAETTDSEGQLQRKHPGEFLRRRAEAKGAWAEVRTHFVNTPKNRA